MRFDNFLHILSLHILSRAALVCAVLLVLPFFATAVSISGDNQQVTFKPGLNYTYSYGIGVGSGESGMIDSYVTGNLPNMTDYVHIIDPDQGGGSRGLTVEINFPQYLPPGNYEIFLGGKEHVADNAPIGGIVAIQLRIRVKVLSPQKYLDVAFNMPNGNTDDMLNITISVANNGIPNLSRIMGDIEIYDKDNALKDRLRTNTISVISDTTGLLTARLNTSNMPPDVYRAVLTVSYDGETKGPMESGFRIGMPELKINSHTKEFAKDAINKLTIDVMSGWNGKLFDVYCTVNIGAKKLQSPVTTLRSFEGGTLITYWETEGMAYGEYPAKITVFYSYLDQKGNEASGSSSIDTVLTISPAKVPADERPESLKEKQGITLSPMMLIYIAIVLVLVIFIVYLLRKGKNVDNQ